MPSPLAGFTFICVLHGQSVRLHAFREAQRLAGDKGILNLGAGCRRSPFARATCVHPAVVGNVDLAQPPFYAIDLEEASLPFGDGEFGCAFASHVLEHLENWEAALTEWARVADYVVLVLPAPFAPTGWLAPEHKQHFSFRDRRCIEARWSTVKVYM